MSAEATVEGLARELSSYLDTNRINQVRRAYYYAEQAHEGQMRKSGDRYITHPWLLPIFSPTCGWIIRV